VHLQENFMHRTLGALVIAISLAHAPTAEASPRRDRVVIRTADIDANTERGARMMLRRIDHAADLACGQSFARQYPSARPAFRRCHELIVARAVDQIDAPALRALHGMREHT
jgi:UrcA family protein